MEAEIREDYLESLQELTVASRPIIKTLTEIAQENADSATAIVEAIDQHSMQCPPRQKLPTLYLIDSICKNVGEPYPTLFSPRIVRIFSNAFEIPSESTRLKLNEQFKTWTYPSEVTGQPLFAHEILREINDFMISQQMNRDSQPNPVSAPAPRSAPQRLNQSALLVEMNRYRSTLDQDPADQFTEKQLQMLTRFEAQVSGVVDPKILPQIQSELEDLKASREQYLSRKPLPTLNRRRVDRRDNRRPISSNGRDQYSNNSKQRPYRGGGVEKSTGTNSGARSTVPAPSETELTALTHAFNRQPQNNASQDQMDYETETTPEPESHSMESTSSGSQTPVPGTMQMQMPMPPIPSMTIPMPPHMQHLPPMPVPEMMMGLGLPGSIQVSVPGSAPGSAVGSAPGSATSSTGFPGSAPMTPEPELPELDLETASKTDATPDQIAQLYSSGLPLQCSTCGYRFQDTEMGREAKQAEMDWHFRANKDIREGRSRSRCRFLSAEQWIKYRDEDEVFGSGSEANGAGPVSTNGDTDAPVDMDKEREKYIEVPMDSNAVCPVCQEPHETSWSEEAENWVWMNTVDIDGLYFHATCYADPQNKELVASVLDSK